MEQTKASTYKDEKLGLIARLENGLLSAEIAIDCGSNLISLTHKGRELIHTDRDALLEHAYTGCFVLYPFPNRITNREFTFDGTTYNLDAYPKRVPDDALIHGVAHDGKWVLDGTPFVENEKAVTTTSFLWDETQEYFSVFPLPSQLMLEYRLSAEALRIRYVAKNIGDAKIPFGFALHPSFNRLSGDETTLTLPSNTVMRMDEKLLPTGEDLDVNMVMFRQFDLRTPVPVNAALRLDHVFTDLIPGKHSIISHPTEHLSIHVQSSEDCKYIVLHTLGKDRTIEIEPQTCSTDALNAENPEAAGMIMLNPGETHEGFIEYIVTEE